MDKQRQNKNKLKILTASSFIFAMFSPLFIAKLTFNEAPKQVHLGTSLYRSISSIEREDNEEERKSKPKQKRESSKDTEDTEDTEDNLITLCENKKKIQSLDEEIKKLEKEKEKVSKIIDKLEDKDEVNNQSFAFSNDILSQLLMQQIYLNQMLTQSMMTTQYQGPMMGDARFIVGNSLNNMSTSQMNNYAGLALYNQAALGLQRNQTWSPQFNANGSLSNSMYDTTDSSNPYSNNYRFAADHSVYQFGNSASYL